MTLFKGWRGNRVPKAAWAAVLGIVMLALSAPAPALSLSGGGLGGGGDALPSVDEAIQVVTDADWDRQQLLVSFMLHDQVYLYQHKLGFTLRDANGNLLEDFEGVTLPPAKEKTDEIYGDVRVYYGQVDVILPLDSVPLADTELEVRYQGCIEDRLCYPPEVRTYAFSAPAPGQAGPADSAPAPTAPPVAPSADDQDGFFATLFSEDANAFNQWMNGRGLGLIVALFFAGGILLAFTPCVFPMVPILSGIIAGRGHGDGQGTGARRGFVLSVAYVLGVAVPYTLAGLLVAVFGAGLNLQFLLQQPAAIVTSVVIFVLLALSMFGLYELQLPAALRDRLSRTGGGGGGVPGAVVMGVISALVVSPCVTPILAGALLYVAGTGDALTGAASLFALALGMGVPLIIFGTGGGHLLPRAGLWMEEIKRFFGVVMLGVAIWLLDRIVSDTLTLGLYGLLLLIYGVQLGALEPVAEGGSRLKRALALVLALYGAIMLIGAASGGSDPWQPLAPIAGPAAVAAAPASAPAASADGRPAADGEHGPWISLAGRRPLLDALAASAAANRPVLVDFFAEWCVACKVMEDTTLADPRVLDAMGGFDLYRVDITEINEENQRIMSDFNIFGLPSFVFFDPDGKEVPDARVLGEMNPERFLKHLDNRILPVTGG
ncbi:protein-disulfide reductase DsbD [Alloalcanivorax gelatiniphagus]|uniref:Protein-disulfide reductase DsbD n=2 Tax=Alloalcanivorax gelatiniphagus TaxID=1194167 RepID=A0ABY2XJW7_9GAMM|nr:protein-disulfide reductase DsbD [Alloalcanivorax gelatiniphagus]TMW12246.1 protein-disulfide reductase DsbD [Alloalcanivorax gelatiniphagus]